MIQITNEQVTAALHYQALINALRAIFQSSYTMPVRHHHFYQTEEGVENTLILMPVWNDRYLGVKQVVVAPLNSGSGLPAIHASYTLMDARTGVPLAQLDAAALTARRTACTSALAASFLARSDAETLLVVGSGKVAQHLVQAHAAVHAYRHILIWARNPQQSRALADQLAGDGYTVDPAYDLEAAAREADVISCATLSPTPIIKGEWLKPGAHLDLIGSHTPKTREVDDEAIRRSKVFVDSREGAPHETGELAIPIARGVLAVADIKADIVELCRGLHPGRTATQEITLFKSAGLAIEDLAAALLVYESVNG
ncbi:ornithine cyclodeaminase family protein [Parapedobacter koreensis]|uniref:Ornithine cyclodeaminase n=1 Tax=Parapedobacter koreensis TaxID=332977 RepID=A0A1H7GE20_9SPHI|nr:ornithine cyclodeaminase family protein [Parapedobacter koreensis]SEK34720.1 ornithine cyclodeaminase [Parapedobacter koreensis]